MKLLAALNPTLYRAYPRQDGAEILAWQLRGLGMTDFERELRFHEKRRWRLDIAFKAKRLAIEVEGFAAGGAAGRHTRIGGYYADIEKYNELTLAGWRLLRVTSKHVKSGQALAWIERALA